MEPWLVSFLDSAGLGEILEIPYPDRNNALRRLFFYKEAIRKLTVSSNPETIPFSEPFTISRGKRRLVSVDYENQYESESGFGVPVPVYAFMFTYVIDPAWEHTLLSFPLLKARQNLRRTQIQENGC